MFFSFIPPNYEYIFYNKNFIYYMQRYQIIQILDFHMLILYYKFYEEIYYNTLL